MAAAADCVDLEELLGAVAAHAQLDPASLDRGGVNAELGVLARLQGWKDARQAKLTRRLHDLATTNPAMFPEADLAASSKGSLGGAGNASKRAATLGAVPELESALSGGEVSADHVDVLGRALHRLTPEQRSLLAADGARLALIAGRSTPEQFAKVLRREIARMDPSEGAERLAKQMRSNSLRSWTDPLTGMVCIKGEFDPESGLSLLGRMENVMEAMFHAGVPDTCPTGDGRQDHLRALALIALVNGGFVRSAAAAGSSSAEPSSAGSSSAGDVVDDANVGDNSGDAERGSETNPNDGPFWSGDIGRAGDRTDVIVIIDLETLLNGLHDRSIIDNSHGVELPVESYRRMACQAGIIPVVFDSDGVVLDEGRRVRLATRVQRRALRAMYSTCAIPGCRVRSRHCQPHHINYWTPPNRGPTNLDNLLPLCSRHHHCAHEGGWRLVLHRDRSLTITYPDGTIQTTGPPGQEQAA